MIICGRKSLSDEERDENGSYSTPKRSKKSKSVSKFIGKGSKKENPYAGRGLDKFYKLLADHEEKKQKIYREIGVEEVSLVRFVYSDSSKHVSPIVVRVKNSNSNGLTKTAETMDERVDDRNEENRTSEKKKEKCLNNRSCYCLGVMVVLVLLFLAIYGRFFAIICATIMWYLVSLNLEGAHHHQGK